MSKTIFQTSVYELGDQMMPFMMKGCLCCSVRMFRIH